MDEQYRRQYLIDKYLRTQNIKKGILQKANLVFEHIESNFTSIWNVVCSDTGLYYDYSNKSKKVISSSLDTILHSQLFNVSNYSDNESNYLFDQIRIIILVKTGLYFDYFKESINGGFRNYLRIRKNDY